MSSWSSKLIADSVHAHSVGSMVNYGALVPADLDSAERLPLVLHLHGAMSSSASLDAAKAAYDEQWQSGELPRAIVACVSTPTVGGFYIDYPNGPKWESLVSEELPEIIARRFPLDGTRALIGCSMGGYGALKMAFRAPERYVAVAALSPAIFPGETLSSVPERNRISILGQLHSAMGETDQQYALNSVYGILRANIEKVRQSSLEIFVDCGSLDEYALHDGAVYLERLLGQLNVRRQFTSVIGAGDANSMVGMRQAEAIRFLGRAMWNSQTVERLRERADRSRR